MASILRVNTLTDASSNNSIAMSVINQGTIKYWINFTSVSSTSARDSTNHASLTDNGTGDTTLNFSSFFSNNDYCFSGNAQRNDDTEDAEMTLYQDEDGSLATGSMRVITKKSSVTDQIDVLGAFASATGDLA
jgi:hypothetical protein